MKVSGRVQGVFYRQTTRQKAQELGLTGWVRNMSDGSVEIEAAGPAKQIENLLSWCRQGPAGAQVTGLKIQEEEETTADSLPDRFEIRY